MTDTYRELITSSLRLVGVVSQGQAPTGEQAQESLEVLRELIDSWNGSDILLFKTQGVVHDLNPGQASYSIGPTGEIAVFDRPTQLQAAFVESSDGYDHELSKISATEFGRIGSKTQTGTPTSIHYSPGYPNATVTLYPVPNTTIKLKLHYLEPLNSNINLDAVTQLPPAYRAALRYNLAIALYAEYGLEPSPTVSQLAHQNLLRIQQNNVPAERLQSPFRGGHYNIYTDGHS